jgi:hypothetical protein
VLGRHDIAADGMDASRPERHAKEEHPVECLPDPRRTEECLEWTAEMILAGRQR